MLNFFSKCFLFSITKQHQTFLKAVKKKCNLVRKSNILIDPNPFLPFSFNFSPLHEPELDPNKSKREEGKQWFRVRTII
jgi:hypothetical protein